MERAMKSPLGRVTVVERDGEWHVLAREPIRSGETILAIGGDLVGQPSQYSIQLSDDLHIEVPMHVQSSQERMHAHYPWRFLNHSCAPTAGLRGRELVALRDIDALEEITFDYDTSEYDMARPFRCRCGHCGGREIRGFRHLTDAERRRRAPYLAPYLRRHLDSGAH
jgi:hypothetical protein